MVRDIVADVLLGLAVAVVLSASVGVLVMRDAYAKLHFVTPAALVAPALVTLAVFVQMGLYENTGETFVALLFMVIAGPYLSHATIRAMRIREKGDWRLAKPGPAPAKPGPAPAKPGQAPAKPGQAPAEEKEQ
jgi:multicomponent Na+:H+ antiporter subunit G